MLVLVIGAFVIIGLMKIAFISYRKPRLIQ